MFAAMQFDRAKLKAAILHTCRSCTPDRLGAVKMHKVLYFLDMIHYAHFAVPVTGAMYRKRPFGPTCVQLLPMLAEMEASGLIEIREVNFFGRRKKEYIALQNEEAGVLNESELALLDEVVDFVCEQNSAKSISDYSHQMPWEMVEFGEEIPYESALLLIPSPVSPKAFDAASEGLNKIGHPRSKADTMDLPKLGAFRGRVLAAAGRS